MYNWSGFYVGANAGAGSSQSCWADAIFGNEGCHNAIGGNIGAQIGYRWQSSAWVLGLEAQGDWADLEGSNDNLVLPLFFTNHSRVNAIGLVTGQVGYAAGNTLFYVKGGAAVTGNHFEVTAKTGSPPNSLAANTPDQVRWGGALGVGAEYGFAPNWSLGLEYDHLFMPDQKSTFLVVPPPFAGTLFGSENITQGVDLVTARLNYRFGG